MRTRGLSLPEMRRKTHSIHHHLKKIFVVIHYIILYIFTVSTEEYNDLSYSLLFKLLYTCYFLISYLSFPFSYQTNYFIDLFPLLLFFLLSLSFSFPYFHIPSLYNLPISLQSNLSLFLSPSLHLFFPRSFLSSFISSLQEKIPQCTGTLVFGYFVIPFGHDSPAEASFKLPTSPTSSRLDCTVKNAK